MAAPDGTTTAAARARSTSISHRPGFMGCSCCQLLLPATMPCSPSTGPPFIRSSPARLEQDLSCCPTPALPPCCLAVCRRPRCRVRRRSANLSMPPTWRPGDSEQTPFGANSDVIIERTAGYGTIWRTKAPSARAKPPTAPMRRQCGAEYASDIRKDGAIIFRRSLRPEARLGDVARQSRVTAVETARA